ncbi:unnamed protein product [Urochloa decumbens]|uniref:Uncharacterized protein n=1 Tax=Urochloa decumbens TaxID=240449 RepID=A0ABC8VIG0_9POAL
MAIHDDAAATARLINGAIEEVCNRGRCEERKREHYPLYSHAVPQVNARLADLDPWHLPLRFLIKESWKSRRTHSGYWKRVGSTAIRSEGDGSSSPSGSPSYRGWKVTLEFCLKDGTKTDWVMHEYWQNATYKGGPAWFLKENLAICKVFQKCTERGRPSCPHGNTETSVNAKASHSSDMILDSTKEQAREDDDMMRWTELNLMKLYLLTGGERFYLYKEDPGRLLKSVDLGGSESRSGSAERPTGSDAPNGKSKVWQNFTKIYTKDPDVVYAACHRCDKLLSAHSKNGTSHLRNHCEKCSGHNPSTAEDQEMLRQLRAILDTYKQGTVDSMEVNANLDPWELQSTPCYVTSSLGWETHQGCWKEIKKELTAIRMEQLLVPKYLGLRRTLEFHHNNGTKMDWWIMHEYNQVDECRPPHLFLQGDMVFRKVFYYDKAKVTEAFREMDRWLNDQVYCNGEQEELRCCFSGEGVQSEQSRPGKRKRTGASDGSSDVWFNFSKVYTADPDKVYAVCHFCDIVFGGHSKNGTSHLKRHNEKCSSKHHKREEEVWPFELIFKILKEQDSGACTEAGNKEMA